MKRSLIIVMLLYTSSVCFSQKPDRFIYNLQQSSNKLNIIDQSWPIVRKASFPGGENAFENYFKENIIYPDELMEYGRSGKIIIKFSIEPDGSISDVSVKRMGFGCVECTTEVIRLFENMPKWIPAVTIKNQPIKSMYLISMQLTIQ